MDEHVLPVGRAVAQPPEEVDQLGVHVGDAEPGDRVLARPAADQVDLGLAALVGLLDALRVDPAVADQPLKGEAADLPAHRVEARQEHRLRRVVDDQVDAGHRLEGPDVAALAADDPALHLVAGQVHDRDDRLARLLDRDPLDGERHDLARPLVGLGLGGRLDVPDRQRRLALGLVVHRGDELRLRRLRGQPGDPLKLGLGRGAGLRQ